MKNYFKFEVQTTKHSGSIVVGCYISNEIIKKDFILGFGHAISRLESRDKSEEIVDFYNARLKKLKQSQLNNS